MVDLDKHDDLHTPTIGEIVRRIERLERQTDGWNDRVCDEIDQLKMSVSHLSLGFSAIKWIALSVIGTGVTVIITSIAERMLK